MKRLETLAVLALDSWKTDSNTAGASLALVSENCSAFVKSTVATSAIVTAVPSNGLTVTTKFLISSTDVSVLMILVVNDLSSFVSTGYLEGKYYLLE